MWLLVLLLLALPDAKAQPGAPVWQQPITTAQGAGGSSVAVLATATNAAGDVFVAGQFQGTAIFGNTTLLSTYTLASSGRYVRSADVFVAKWSKATGQFAWAVPAGSSEADNMRYLVVRGAAVYLGGTFAGDTLHSGTAQVLAPAVAAGGTADKTFVARFNDAGGSADVGWALGLGGTLTGLVAAPAGVVLMGRYTGTLPLGSLVLNGPLLPAGGRGGATFLATLAETASGASFSAAHNLTFSAGMPFSNEGTLLTHTLTAAGSTLYLMGAVGPGTVLVDGAPAATVSASSGGLFVLKLALGTTSLTAGWLALATAPPATLLWDAQVHELVVSGSSLVFTGSFIGALQLGGDVLLASGGLTNQYYADAFVGKLTDTGPSGRFDWGLRAGNKGTGIGKGLGVRGTDILWAASFATTGQGNDVSFGTAPFALGGSSVGRYLAIAKIVDSGSSARFDWAKPGGSGTGTYSEVGNVALAGDGTMYTAVTMGGSGGFGQYSVPVGGGLYGQGTAAGVVASILGTTALGTTPAAGPLAGSAVYPNPAHATATVQLPAVPGTAQATLTLRDALGRAVRTATVALPAAGRHHLLDLASLPAGLYALQVQAGSATATHRLVVE